MGNQILIYRLYDVADRIDLAAAESRLSQSRGTARVKLDKVSPKSMHFTDPPLAAEAGPAELNIGGRPVTLTLGARIYDLGVIGIVGAIEVPPEATHGDWLRLITAINPKDVNRLFRERMDSIKEALGPALKAHDLNPFVEDFTVFYFTQWNQDWDPVPLLLAETGEVSAQTRRDVLANTFSYSPDDLAIITWDSALIYQADGNTDLLDLIELANTQLLELRVYDALLSMETDKAHAEIRQAARKTSYRRLQRYRAIMKRLMELTVEVTEIVERVRNTLKVTEDVYYARVYGAATDILHTGAWMDSINRKIDLIQRSYSMLSDEVVTERSNLLEVAVVILIVLEVVVALWPLFRG